MVKLTLTRALQLWLLLVVALNTTLYAQEDHYLSFDGTDDYIALPISYSGVGSVPVISVEAWVRTTFSGGNYNSNWAIVDFDRSDFYDLFVRGDDGRVGFSTYASSGAISDFYGTTAVNDGQWHHIVGVYDGTDKLIYVDGVLDASLPNPHSGAALGKATTRFGFIGDGSEAGAYNAGRNNLYYEGDISEVRIWNRVLDAAEIDSNKLPGAVTGSETDLVALYTFDNGQATDLSPNGFDGGIFNGPVFNNTDGVPNGGGPPTGGSSVWSTNGTTAYYEEGPVGVGTQAVPAGYQLAVNGNLIAEEIRVELSGNWPDYVFEKAYQLPPLAEVQRYIDEHGHLPHVPSAEEVETEGLELGEMNRLLLEKIEQLTLYMIAQEKRLNEQQKEIDSLKSNK